VHKGYNICFVFFRQIAEEIEYFIFLGFYRGFNYLSAFRHSDLTQIAGFAGAARTCARYVIAAHRAFVV
jgi:hypothetical protein